MSETWLALGQHFEPSGHSAYALEKSAAYGRMTEESRRLFDMAGGSWLAEGETLFNYICHLRMKRQRFVIFHYPGRVYAHCLCRPFGDQPL